MNAYDFDNTIYDGDSTVHFVLWCARRYPRALWHLLGTLPSGARFALGRMDKTAFKQRMFGFLRYVPDADAEAERFWAEHIGRIKPFYLLQRREDDLIISASPEFLLRPAMRRLHINRLIASRVDKRTGRYDGLNCDGEQKRARLLQERPDAAIEAFYSDSPNDAPLAQMARQAYMVRGGEITHWPL